MGFLAPLYALAALAIVGPIVFHLIQRQPRGEKVFSSLMFLSPSPPTLTRRSRLDNLLLLLLRALAIGLIAFAFARPYLRSNSMLNSSLEGRRMAILLDTSASMRRPDVWQSALDSIRGLLTELSPEDRVALYTIDRRLAGMVPFDEEPTRPAVESQQAVVASLKELEPGWQSGELATGLKQIADTMTAAMLTGSEQDPVQNLIVLVSDLHEQSGLDGMQGYPWPENVQLDVRQIQPTTPGNARATLVRSEDQATDSSEKIIKVRVENNNNSQDQVFQLVWQWGQEPEQQVAGTSGDVMQSSFASEPIQIQVTPGQARVFPVGRQPPGADRLTLIGDAWTGDNQLFISSPEPTLGTIAFIGPTRQQPEDQLEFFIEQAPLGNAFRQRQVERLTGGLFDASDRDMDAVIIQPDEQVELQPQLIRDYVAQGGTAMIVLAEVLNDSQQSAVEALLRELTGNRQLRISEGRSRDFALLSRLEYTHPVFAPFADPRFNDFSKIRFWSHRQLEGLAAQSSQASQAASASTDDVAGGASAIPGLDASSGLRVIASFDDETPFLIEQTLGQGKLWVMTAGWQPSASTLALSSKFVPIMLQLIDPSGSAQILDRGFEVGESIKLQETFGSDEVRVLNAAGSPAAEDDYAIQAGRLTFLRPDAYVVVNGSQESRPVAIHIPMRESQLEPLDLSVFDQYGISLGKVASDLERKETERQRSALELENQQRIWQWLVAFGLVLLIAETALAGWKARQSAARLSTGAAG